MLKKLCALILLLLLGWGAWKYLAPSSKEEPPVFQEDRLIPGNSTANSRPMGSKSMESPSSVAEQGDPKALTPIIPKIQEDVPIALSNERRQLYPPSPEKRARLTRVDMDESESKISPRDPLYDQEFLLETLEKRQASAPWREGDFHPIAAGYYDVVLENLNPPAKKFLFYVDLEKYKFRGASWLYPTSISYQNPDPKWQTINVEKWRSPYLNEEIYFGALHFPYDVFWKGFFNGDCKEVVVIYVTLLSSASSNGLTNRFTARGYCRTGLKSLIPFALMNFSRNEGS